MAFNCPHCQKGITNAVPKERFDEVNEKRKEAERGAALAEQLGSRVEELEGKLTSQGREHSVSLKMAEAGIKDGDLREAFQWQYGRLGEENRPEFGEWFDGIMADPNKAPVVLRPFLKGAAGAPAPAPAPAGAPAPAPAGAPAPAPAPSPAPPPANGGVVPYQDAPNGLTPQAIAAMSPEQYAANRAQIWKNARWGEAPALPGAEKS